MTYQETIDFLYSQLPAFQNLGSKAIKPKLTNIIELCEILGNPQDNFKSIHVAGTNGKGSSSHFLTSILMEAGYKVGLYTSPHLKDYRERFRINGNLVPENYIIEFVQTYSREISILKPSFFELSVALAFKVFSDEKVDIAVIEVGLGGRLDSTNIIRLKELALITNIGFDHTDVLGKTLDKIAFEKAGIIKSDVPVVISEYLEETKPVFEAVAAENNSQIIYAQDEYCIELLEDKIDSLELILKTKDKEFRVSSGLVGEYQKSNIRGVLASVEVLNLKGYAISNESIFKGFKEVVKNTGLKGRWQILGEKPMIICDIGHNEHAFEITINRIRKEHFENRHFVLGFVKDKNLDKIQRLIPEGSYIYLCEFNSGRALNEDDLKELRFTNAKKVSIYKSVNLAIQSAKENANERDVIFIGGSTYLVAEVNDL